MKVTKKNADAVCQRLADLVKASDALRARFNQWLDAENESDWFGTEGQLDPRRGPKAKP